MKPPVLGAVLALASLLSSGYATTAWTGEVADHRLDLPGIASPGVRWTWTDGTARTDWINRIAHLRDGSYVAVGFVNRDDSGAGASSELDAVVRRFRGDGSEIWTRRIANPGIDAAWSVKEAADGRIAIGGFSELGGAGGTDMWLLVLDRDGQTLIDQRFGGPAGELGLDVVPANDGGYLLVGQTFSFGAGERDVFLVKTDAAGNEIWRKTYGGPEVDRGFYGVATADGGFAVVGVTGAERSYDMLAMKVDESGEQLWRQVFGTPGGNDPNHGITLLPDGRIAVLGYTNSWGSPVHDLMAVILSDDGRILSRQLIGGPGDDRVMNTAVAADGGVWLTGYTKSFAPGEDWNVMLAKLNADGTFEPWMASLGGTHNEQGTSLVQTPEGDLVIGGYTNALSEGEGAPDMMLLRLDPAALTRHTDGVAAREMPSAPLSAGRSPSRP